MLEKSENEKIDPRAILDSLSRTELERVLRRRLDEGDLELEELILSLHADKSDVRSPSTIVQKLIHRHLVQEDEVEDPAGLALDLYRLYDRAMTAASDGEHLFAVRLISQAVEAAAPFAFGFDDEAEIMDGVNEGFNRLVEIAEDPQAAATALHELGAWARRSVAAPWARGGDSWDVDCLDLAARAARDEDIRETLIFCTRFVEDSRSDEVWNYCAERGAIVVIELLARVGDVATRGRYIEEHLSFGGVRSLAIEEALATADYNRAIELCRDGVQLSRNGGLAGLVDVFEGRLIEALDRVGNRTEATQEFERYVTESFTTDRFVEFKKRHGKQALWIEARDRIISNLTTQENSSHALAAIYRIEDMPEPLLALATHDVYLFSDYLETIGQSYPEQAARFLKARIERELRAAAKRAAYARNAESIVQYGTYAGKEAAEALFDSLLLAYPTRRAMREEFAKKRRRLE